MHDYITMIFWMDKHELYFIWRPPLSLTNSLGLLSLLDNKYLNVQIIKQSQGQFRNENDLNEGILYDGKDNDLLMSAKFEEDFSCSYDLKYYPFDSQLCTIDLAIPYPQQNVVRLVPGKITYTGVNPSTAQFTFNTDRWL